MMEMELIRRCQREALEILLDFQRVCEALGLRFYLTAGTLLGAVRHGGFIPWDDDIDVAMPRKDYNRLAEEGKNFFAEKYVYQDYQTEPNFPCYFSKLRKRGTRVVEPVLGTIAMEQGYYIDIFPLDCCPDGESAGKVFFKGVELLNCALISKVSTSFVCGYRKKYMRLLWLILRKLPNSWLFALRESVRKTAGKGASGQRLCTVGGAHGYPRETYRAEWFAGVEEMEFEGCTFPVPADWDALLRNMYGEYMVMPPEEERQRHFIE